MIGQYLPQTNKSGTVPKILKFCQLNKAYVNVCCRSCNKVVDALVAYEHRNLGGTHSTCCVPRFMEVLVAGDRAEQDE